MAFFEKPLVVRKEAADDPTLPGRLLAEGDFVPVPADDCSPDPLLGFRWNEKETSEKLEIFELCPVRVEANAPDAAEGLETLTQPEGVARVSGPVDLGFDFGVESAGWLEFVCENLPEGVTASISEYSEPAILNAGAVHSEKTARPVRRGRRWRLELNPQLYEGARFGWIHFPALDRPVEIREVRLVCQMMPRPYAGTFLSDQQDLNAIWHTGAYSVRLNLLPDGFSAILMERSDRHSWTGDAYPSQAASMTAFGNWEDVRKNLERTARDDNQIKGFSLYWILSLHDYHLYSGDTIFAREHLPLCREKLDGAFRDYETPRDLGFMGHDDRLGAAFENPDLPENQRLFRMLTLRACRALERMARWLGEKEQARDCRRRFLEKRRRLQAEAEPFAGWGIHSAAEAVNAGVVLPAQREGLIASHFSEPSRLISFSPFNQTFILQALGRLGLYETALAVLRRCWGGQLNLGATTFWEVFRPEWADWLEPNEPVPNSPAGYTSLCHPWGAGVITWLTENILGVRPVKPGFQATLIAPRLPEGCRRMEGEVPTPAGTIRLRLKDEHPPALYLDSPDAVRLLCRAPFSREDPKGRTPVEIFSNPQGDGATRRLFWLSEKAHVFSQGAVDFSLPLAGAKRLAMTGGNWGGQMGREGFLLFHGEEEGRHLHDLPEGIQEVRLNPQGRMLCWERESEDERAAAPDSSNGLPRAAVAHGTNNPAVCSQSFSFEIICKPGYGGWASLYCVDWDRQERRQMIEWFDGQTLDPVMPPFLLEDFEEGAWLRFRLDRSLRIRINHIRGGDAVVSGLFFDPRPEKETP